MRIEALLTTDQISKVGLRHLHLMPVLVAVALEVLPTDQISTVGLRLL